jgi:hypothetical protein
VLHARYRDICARFAWPVESPAPANGLRSAFSA